MRNGICVMGEFKKRARLDMKAEGHIPGPLQKKFTPQRWEKAFKECGDPDDEDLGLYVAALAIHEKLSAIRANLKVSISEELTPTTKLRCFVAAANHSTLLASKKAKEAIAKAAEERAKRSLKGFSLEELTAVKLTLLGGAQASPDAVVESLVDGIEMPVGFVLSSSPDLAGNPNLKQVRWVDIAIELNLGIFYRFAEDVWDDCLWNGYKLLDQDKRRFFYPTQPAYQKAHVMGIARRRSLAMAFSVVARQFQLQMAAAGLAVDGIREVREIEKVGKRQVLKVSKPRELTEAQDQLMALRAYASEPYYSELLQEQAPNLNGLTLNDVLAAWTVISRASKLLMEALDAKAGDGKDDAPPQSWLPQYAPTLQVDALVAGLRAAAGFGPQAARSLIDFLTYRGGRDREIWSQPLVPVGPSTVAPVFAAIFEPNLRRLVDIWMRQAGIDMSKRGEAFEAHIRAVVQQAISESKLLSGHATSISEDYTFTPSGQGGVQFDLLFILGTTIFVVEAKCVLEPTEAKGVAMHRKTVMEAADQALLRAQVLDANRPAFIADMKRRFDMVVPDDFSPVPLVLVSTATHVGVPAKGVAVIDEFILERYLAGELEDLAVQGFGFEVVDRAKILFYTDAKEAETRAAKYFANPPQMRRFVQGVGAELTPLPAVAEGDWEGAVVSLSCHPEGALPAFAGANAAELGGGALTAPKQATET